MFCSVVISVNKLSSSFLLPFRDSRALIERSKLFFLDEAAAAAVVWASAMAVAFAMSVPLAWTATSAGVSLGGGSSSNCCWPTAFVLVSSITSNEYTCD